MKSKGVYYMPRTDRLVLISKCDFYEDIMLTKPFSLVTWIDERGTFANTLIRKDQFKFFKRIGDL